MYSTHCTTTMTWTYHWIKIFLLIINHSIVIIQTYSTNHCRLVAHIWSLWTLFYNICHLWSSKFRFCFSRFLHVTLDIFNSLDIKSIQKRWWSHNFNSAVDADISFTVEAFYLLVKLNIIDIYYRIFVFFSVWANIGFVSFGDVASWTLTSVWFVEIF